MLASAIDQDPAPTMIVYPSKELAERTVEAKLEPMIRQCKPCLLYTSGSAYPAMDFTARGGMFMANFLNMAMKSARSLSLIHICGQNLPLGLRV